MRSIFFWLSFLFVAINSVGALAQDQTWAFEYPAEGLRAGAALDLRYLNENVAGGHGFLRVAADGRGFVFADGTAARFWCVNAAYRSPMETLRRQARFLAKIGVNMVRLHTAIDAKEAGAGITDVDEKEIDYIWRSVAANKEEGIYTTISPYWANSGFIGGQTWGIAGYPQKTDLWGVLFFNAQLQEGYRAWVKALYTRVNPYTGVALGKDPAVAIIEVQNEDSLLFWTFDGIKGEQKKLLGKMFGDWVIKKYGSFDAAFTAWGEASVPQDDLGAGVLGFIGLWEVPQNLPAGRGKRLDDQLEFLARTQRDFYAGMEKYYREELGCGQLINACNWITADPIRLNDLERWTYTATDVMAVNRYYNGGAHIGANVGWRIDPGDFFEDQWALKNPRQLPTNLKQVQGWPMMVTESSWVSPLGYQAEGPFLMAAYQSLTGVGGYYWFVCTGPGYVDPYLTFLNVRGEHPMQKWTCSTPSLEGNFPAAALVYRMGYLRRGDAVVEEGRSEGELFNRGVPAIAEDPTFDPNRNSGLKAGTSDLSRGVDPMAFLVGPVEMKVGEKSLKVAELSKYIDANQKTVRSDTGEVALNWGVGVCTMDAPKAQGVCGFLADGGGKWDLSTVGIESGNEYASVMVVAMDDLPLDRSRKILVQVGTIARPTGWETQGATRTSKDGKQVYQGDEIVNTGRMPWRVADTEVTVSVRNAGLRRATLLDEAGFEARDVPVELGGGKLRVRLPGEAMYLVLSGG